MQTMNFLPIPAALEASQHKAQVVIAFSDMRQYPPQQIHDVLERGCPTFVLDATTFLHPRRQWLREFKKRARSAASRGWATAPELKKSLATLMGLECVMPKPSFAWRFWLAGRQERSDLCRNLLAVRSILAGKQAEVIIGGTPATAEIVDSLQRWVAGFRIERRVHVANQLVAAYYLLRVHQYMAWLRDYLLTQDFEEWLVVTNHQTYVEAGLLLRVIVDAKSASGVLIGTSVSQPIELAPDEFYKVTIIRRAYSHEPELLHQPIAIAQSDYENGRGDESALMDLGDLRSKRLVDNRVLVVMHAFTDANRMAGNSGALFPTYFEWIRASLQIAGENPHVTYIFREHPVSRMYYGRDINAIRELFAKAPANVSLDSNPTRFSFQSSREIPIVVTAQGTVALEMACAGIRSVVVGNPNAPLASFYKATTLSNYSDVLSGYTTINRLLDDVAVREARVWRELIRQSVIA